MDDTCAKENIQNIFIKTKFKCDLGKVGGSKTL